MLEELKQEVYEANLLLPKYNLVTFTWGNVSAYDPSRNLVVIKPSGVSYNLLRPQDMVVVALDGSVVEGTLRPSSDTPTHLELYKSWNDIGSVVHTHSTFATSWAQAKREIPCYGTTHADYIHGSVPIARNVTKQEMDTGYEMNTGRVILETFEHLDHNAIPCVLCANHGVFSWGGNAIEAVHNAVVLEEVAKMALYTEQCNPNVEPAPIYLQDKHYFRKHGKNAYYGQECNKTD